MKCPNCGLRNLSVSDSRYRKRSNGWSRKRLCNTCGYEFRTTERYSLTVEEMPDVRIYARTERNLENINRIKAMAKEMNIKLAED